MKKIFTIFMILMGCGYGQCVDIADLESPVNTGSNMTLGLLLNNWPEEVANEEQVWISAQIQNWSEIYGEMFWYVVGMDYIEDYNDFFALAVWGDESINAGTPLGATPGQDISLFLHLENGSCYQIVPNPPIDYDTNDVIVIDSVSFVLLSSNNNNPPTAQDATHTLDEDTSITLALEAYSAEGDALISAPMGNAIFTIVDESINGEILILQSGVHYIPDVNFNGIDSFQFQVNDGQLNSNIATVTLIINAINDAPYLHAIENASIIDGDTFSYSLQAEDVDGDALIYTATALGGNATVNIDGNILTVTPYEANVTLNVVVTVSDGNATDSTSFLLTVAPQLITCFDNNRDGWCDQFPTIIINEGSVLLFETEEGVEYTDPGAQCYDNEDGDISEAVAVSGQIVNMAIPDMYQITYDCSDADGNAAQTIIRTVVVVPHIISDENEDGFDDDGFMAGSQSGDANMDGFLNIVDIVIFVNSILSGE